MATCTMAVFLLLLRMAIGNQQCNHTITSPLSCVGFERPVGQGLTVCPIFNGGWTSFLDEDAWGSETQSLRGDQRLPALLQEMQEYVTLGMRVFIGEDFDRRVMSLLEAHSNKRRRPAGGALQQTPNLSESVYSIIVEAEEDVERNIRRMLVALGLPFFEWLHLGPPALEHLRVYRSLQRRGVVVHIGVEDFSPEQLQYAGEMLRIATVQQEINLIVRPHRKALAFCRRVGCQFVAYGSLLGGLLSDEYLGHSRPPSPDAAHSKQADYLESIEIWGGWNLFQRLLRVLRDVADTHRSTIAEIAMSYTLNLPHMLGLIVGVRLGSGSAHRNESMRALRISLSPAEKAQIGGAVGAGRVMDGLTRT